MNYCIYWNEQRRSIHYMKTNRAKRFRLQIIEDGLTEEEAENKVVRLYDDMTERAIANF